MRAKILILCLVLVAAAALGLQLYRERVSDVISRHVETIWKVAPQGPIGEPAAPPTLISKYTCEEHWIVSSVCNDIAEILYYARDLSGGSGPGVPPSLTIARKADGSAAFSIGMAPVPGGAQVPYQLTIDSYIWSPETYATWARHVMEVIRLSPAPRRAPTSAEFLQKEILDLRAVTIQKQNRRVSDWLQSEPLDPAAHEAAALVLAAFAFREASGTFFDQRSTLNRMTAHLALARALRGGDALDDTGSLADVALRVFAGRQQEAEAMILLWRVRPGLTPVQSSWLRALSLRNVGDWRASDSFRDKSLLEKIACFRARAEHLRPAAAIKLFQEAEPEPIADWTRILAEQDFGVEIGHFVGGAGIALELSEIAEARGVPEADLIDPSRLAEILDAEPGGAVSSSGSGKPRIQVIDDGAWGRFAQRHLCHIAARTDFFLRKLLGDKDAAEEFSRDIHKKLGNALYFPIVRRLRAHTQDEFSVGQVESGKLAATHPECISDNNWGLLRSSSRQFRYVHAVPEYEQWFRPEVPTGTAYQVDMRIGFPSIREGPLARLEAWRDLAPADRELAWVYAYRKHAGKPTAAQCQEIYGALADYDLKLMLKLADASEGSPVEYERVMTRICGLDPDRWWSLAWYYRQHDRTEDAAAASRKGWDLGEDRVNAANLCGWLVEYYFDHGQQQQALGIAEEAGRVYSALGLETLMKAYERLDRLEEAEEVARAIESRYDDNGPLFGFCYRSVVKSGRDPFGDQLDSFLEKYFPDGLERVTLVSFSGPPRDGVLFPEETDSMREVGMRRNCVVVAIDGIRVHNGDQYRMAREISLSPEMKLIVWQENQYKEITARPFRRRFGVETKDYGSG